MSVIDENRWTSTLVTVAESSLRVADRPTLCICMGVNDGGTGAQVPVNLECGTLMQTVRQI